MNIRERVLVSRLVQRIDRNEDYAKRIGLTYFNRKRNETKENQKIKI